MKLRYVGHQAKAFPLGVYEPGDVFEIPEWLASAYVNRHDIEQVQDEPEPETSKKGRKKAADSPADTVEADSHGTEEQAPEDAPGASDDVPGSDAGK